MSSSRFKTGLLILSAVLGLSGCGEEDVGDVSLGIFTLL